MPEAGPLPSDTGIISSDEAVTCQAGTGCTEDQQISTTPPPPPILRVVALGNDGIPHVSIDGGLTWVAGDNTPGITYTNKGVAYSPTLDRWVAIAGISGPSSEAIYSDDGGLTWSAGTISVTKNFSSVAWVGDKFIATSFGGFTASSTDGIAWTTSGATIEAGFDALRGIAVGGAIIMVGNDSGGGREGGIWCSEDGGDSWVRSYTGGADTALFDVAYTRGLYIAVGENNTLLTSPDCQLGSTWTDRSDTWNPDFLKSIAYNNDIIVVGSTDGGTDEKVLTSVRGLDWETVPNGNLGTRPIASLVWTGYNWVAGLTGGKVMISSDLKNWTETLTGLTSTVVLNTGNP
jgi:hypothetical protein